MPEFLIFITKFGLHHILPFLLLIFLFMFLNIKTQGLNLEAFSRINLRFTVGISLIVLIHLLEFLFESHEIYPYPYGEEGIEMTEFLLFWAAFGFFIWGIKDIKEFLARESQASN